MYKVTHKKEIKKILDRIYYSTKHIPYTYRKEDLNFCITLGVFGREVNQTELMEMSKIVDILIFIAQTTRSDVKKIGYSDKRKDFHFYIVYFPDNTQPFQVFMKSTTVNDSLETPYYGEERVGIYKGKTLGNVFDKILGILLVLNPEEFKLNFSDIKRFAYSYRKILGERYLGVATRYEDERKDFEMEHLVNFYCEGLDWEAVDLNRVSQITVLNKYKSSIDNCSTKNIDKEILEYIRGK